MEAISKAFEVGKASIYRFEQRKKETGTIDPTYQNCGRKPEVCAEKLDEIDSLIAGNQILLSPKSMSRCTYPYKNPKSATLFALNFATDIKKDVHASEHDRTDVKAKRAALSGMQNTMDTASLIFLD